MDATGTMEPAPRTHASAHRGRLTLLCWNIHSGIGLDRRYRLDRIVRLIRAVDPDIIGLQEVDVGYRLSQTTDQLRELTAALGGHFATGPTLRRQEATYGNLLLSRWPLLDIERIDLSRPGREPRGAIQAEVQTPGGPLRVNVFHLGLQRLERTHQARRLLQRPRSDDAPPTVWMGDANEWWPWRGPLAEFANAIGSGWSPRTFPAVLPLLRLDRFWITPRDPRDRIEAFDRPPARWASDHLPLVARIVWPRTNSQELKNTAED